MPRLIVGNLGAIAFEGRRVGACNFIDEVSLAVLSNLGVAVACGSVRGARLAGSRSSGEWNEDDYDVLADGIVVGRIFKAAASPVGTPWMWTLIFGYHEDRTPTHGYEPTREAAMTAFAKSWRREY
jgi:hypothetical protein